MKLLHPLTDAEIGYTPSREQIYRLSPFPRGFVKTMVRFSQTTLFLGLLFYTPEQDENTYGESLKNQSPTDGRCY